jgi:arsenite methyltransferase
MKNSEEIKEMVRDRYTKIAENDKELNSSCCCGEGGCDSPVPGFTVFSDDYSHLDGYAPEADLGLGCGLPTEFALIKEGDTVVDLGSGAGNDCFVARSITGATGKVIGIDFTEIMIEKARVNAINLGYDNVQFRLGDIEKMPLTTGVADVVISNCVLNLVPDKQKAFSEIFRILKPGGHFSVIKDAGFDNVTIQKDKVIHVPDDILLEYISADELTEFRKNGVGIFSITVYADRPNDLKECGDSCGCRS